MTRTLAARNRLFAAAVLVLALAACTRARPALSPVPAGMGDAAAVVRCDGCAAVPVDDEIVRAVAQRVADLKGRGGRCEAYAAVLEGSLAGHRILMRPFMWRVGTHLASAQALSTGEITVAREVDPLNLGVRSLEDVVQSVEHEAAHIAFAIPSGDQWTESQVDARVGECRANRVRVGTAR